MTLIAHRPKVSGFGLPSNKRVETSVLAVVTVALLVGLAVLFARSIPEGTGPGAGQQTVELAGGGAMVLPSGWQVSDLGGGEVVEATLESSAGAVEARVLVSHVPTDALPIEPILYSDAEVYRPEAAVEGARYVRTYIGDALVVAFAIPAPDGQFYTGQAVLTPGVENEVMGQMLDAVEAIFVP